MINDALTLEIFEALMAQDTINPPGNEKRGALCLKGKNLNGRRA